MPIALFPELTRTLAKVGAALAPWDRLATLEEQILRRARAAFLAHWFGPGVPERQLSLFITIANIAEFRSRYALVRRSMPGPLPAMNLLRPIAGMAGFATGLFFSPSGVFLVAPHIRSLFDMLTDSWWGTPASLMYSLVLNWVMPLLGPGLIIGLGAPLLLAWALGATLSGDRRSRAIVRLTGDAAMLIDAFLGFWAQITGPEEQIRNPVVRGIMVLLRRFSALFAHALGFVALMVTRLLPLIPNLIAQYRAALGLGNAVVDAVRDIATGFFDALREPFTEGAGLRAILTSVLDAFFALPGQLVSLVREAINDALSEFQAAFETLNRMLGTYIGGLRDRIVAAFEQTPVGQMISRIRELVALVPQLTGEFTAIPSVGSGGAPTDWVDVDDTLRSWWMEGLTGGVFGPGLGTRVSDLIGSVRRIRLPATPSVSVPDLPSAPTLPSTPALRSEIGLPAPDDFASEARRMLADARAARAGAELPEALLRRPASAFAEERRRLARLGRPTLSERDLRLRDAIFLAVGRVLPPALRIHAPRLRALFEQIDEQLYGVTPSERPAEQMPQLELPDSGRLRPVVEVLTIRSTGGFAPDLRAFRDLVVDAMERQTYLAPDAA